MKTTNKPKKKKLGPTSVPSNGDQVRPVSGVVDWKPNLCSYKDTRILKFDTTEDLNAAIDLLWSEPLQTLPHDTPDGRSIIVPAEAVPYFTRAGLRFVTYRLRAMSELGPNEISRLRR
ncbi:MAG TPA: hypothetical protein VE988_25460 [Gemmataceae bacterium]|nr:hypothetical protein [Gemmataceae bacterium]